MPLRVSSGPMGGASESLIQTSRGRVQASGTLSELRARHGEEDLEELFFSLVS